jgi:hypothetical protein
MPDWACRSTKPSPFAKVKPAGCWACAWQVDSSYVRRITLQVCGNSRQARTAIRRDVSTNAVYSTALRRIIPSRSIVAINDDIASG